jgi:hypothetical protein
VLDATTKVEEMMELSSAREWAKYMQDGAMAPGKFSERFNRGSAFLGRYEQLRDEGLDHLVSMRRAMETSNKTNFSFNRAGTPPFLRRPVTRLMLMFRSYTAHQIDFTSQLISESAAGIKKKGLIEAAIDGDVDKLARHMTAYLLLAGGAGTFLSMAVQSATGATDGFNVAARAQHPAVDLLQDVGLLEDDFEGGGTLGISEKPASKIGRFGIPGVIGETIGGPFIDTITDLLTGNIEDAIFNFAVPGVGKRFAEVGIPKTADEFVKILGLKRYRRKRSLKGKGKARRGIRGLPRLPTIENLRDR